MYTYALVENRKDPLVSSLSAFLSCSSHNFVNFRMILRIRRQILLGLFYQTEHILLIYLVSKLNKLGPKLYTFLGHLVQVSLDSSEIQN